MLRLGLVVALAACRRDGDDTDPLPTLDTDVVDDERFTAVAVATGDEEGGALAVIDIDTFAVSDSLVALAPDTSLFVKDSVLFAAERSGHDRLRGWRVGEYDDPYFDVQLGAGAEPRSVELCVNRIWVGMAGRPYLEGYTWGADFAGRIELGAYADADALPDVGNLLFSDFAFYATVHRHDTTGALPDDPHVLHIDCASRSVVGAWPTPALEPMLGLYGLDPRKVLVREGRFAPDGLLDGDIAVLNPANGAWSTVVTAAELKGEIGAFGSRGRLGMIAVHAADRGTDLYCADLTTGHVTRAGHIDGAVADIAVDDRERAWVAASPEAGAPASGVQVWELDGCERVAEDIDTALPPRSIAFYRRREAD